MRLLMTADAVGGVWTYALDLCSALSGHGVEVVLATMGPRPTDVQREAVAALDNVQLIESDYRLEWMSHPWPDVDAAAEWLLALAASNDADIVHLNGYCHAALPWSQPVVCVAHSCVWTWWQAVHGNSPPEGWNEYRARVATGLNSADIIIAPTDAFLEQLRACYVFTTSASVIRNGRAHVADDASVAREPIVLACGRPWDASKNMRVLDDAARGAPWTAYVIGSAAGPEGQSFTPGALRSVGPQSSQEVRRWMQRASIFVHPALYEPFGLVVVEAAAAGCALVLADIPTLRELWGGAAEFFEPRNTRSLRTKLDVLLADPMRRKQLATAAKMRANEYRIESAASAYLETYRALLRKRRNGERTAA